MNTIIEHALTRFPVWVWPIIVRVSPERPTFWFRVFGFGLRVADRSVIPSLFSEREGLCYVIRWGKWSIKPLVPWKV